MKPNEHNLKELECLGFTWTVINEEGAEDLLCIDKGSENWQCFLAPYHQELVARFLLSYKQEKEDLVLSNTEPSSLEIVKFLDKTWQEIPERDNPAMQCNMIVDPDNAGTLMHAECIMIYKGNKEAFRVKEGGFVVSRVQKQGDLMRLGVFWRAELAEVFAEALIGNKMPIWL